MLNQRMYQPYYCEENVWHLCQTTQFQDWDCRILFITNPIRCCALWNQKAAPEPGHAIFWDYHVVVLASPNGEPDSWQIWDSDSTLGTPLPLKEYLQLTFGLGTFLETIPQRFHPQFRMLSAQEFLENFSSDRSHMLSSDGEYLQPPPPWSPINQLGPSNISRFWDLDTPFLGRILGLFDLAQIAQ